MSLVRTGIFDTFDEEIHAELLRNYLISNVVTQAEALDGALSLVGSHVCIVIEVRSGNRFCICMEPSQIANGTRMNRWIFSTWLHLPHAHGRSSPVEIPGRK